MPLDIPPGVVRGSTPQATRGRWFDASLVRWSGGVLQPVGGWVALEGALCAEPAQAMLAWRDNAGARWVAIGTAEHLYVYDGSSLTDITPSGFVPLAPGGVAMGYGVAGYGQGAYGTPRGVPTNFLTVNFGDGWSLDTFGEDLMAVASSDGRLLRWSPLTPSSPAAAQSGAPTSNRAVFVTDERHVVLLGAGGDPRTVAWCDQEDPSDWTPTNVNTAGDLQLRTSGRALSARRVREGALIWCDDDVHLMRYIGPPFVYGIERVGEGCGPVALRSMATFNGMSAWLGAQAFYVWAGGLRAIPCDVGDYVFDQMQVERRWQAFASANGAFPECWWFYASDAALTPDCYVLWNYSDNTWSIGRLDRTAAIDPPAFGRPVLCGSTGQVYEHERGWADDDAPMGAGARFAETGDIEIANGDRAMSVKMIVPDQSGALSRAALRFYGKWTPHGPEKAFGPYQPGGRIDGYMDARFQARSVRMRVEGVSDGDWSLGRVKLDVREGARR